MSSAVIKSIAAFLPEQEVFNEDIESRIRGSYKGLVTGSLERIVGSRSRRFAETHIQVSDLASEAARKVLSENNGVTIDLLIFAAASSDLIEPATANIVQSKLGLTCPVMDVKNACNSFVTAIQVASAFIDAGIYKNVLIANGEKLSEVINYFPRDHEHLVRCMAGYSLGDAGTAMLVGKGEGSRIVSQKFMSLGQYWNLCLVEGGGSMAFRNQEKYYFEGNASELRNVFVRESVDFLTRSIHDSGWKVSEIDCVVSHQVSSSTSGLIAKVLGIPPVKCVNTFSSYGNTAAATIPLALTEATRNRQLKKGDKLLIIGLSAGISISVQLIEW